jgi:L-rhamnose mutarotase
MVDQRKKYCFALDLKEDDTLMEAYIEHHKKVWPEIIRQIKSTGVECMEIYQVSNRLFMIMETTEDFSLEAKAAMDKSDPKVQEWEELMSNYQQVLPNAKPGEKWVQMELIFKL